VNIEISDLSYTYNLGSPNAKVAIQDISLKIPGGQNLGLLGATGSGKSTLAQHLNGLLTPQEGSIKFDDLAISKGGSFPRAIRQKIGLVFQFAEFGFFEETVFDEVAFSPRQWGWSEDQILEQTNTILEQIGFPTDIARIRSPFPLSGGQQRMVALASVLVMQPDVLILDEPTVGLDAPTRERIRIIIQSLRDGKRTVVIISHVMDFVSALMDRVVILKNGQVLKDGMAFDVLSNQELMLQAGLEPPAEIRLRSELRKVGIALSDQFIGLSEIKKMLRGFA
jgi:energy-coupling factor transport system ATP-binding protein